VQIRGDERRRRGIGVYVHIPFCRSRCPYCDFNSSEAGNLSGELADRYVACLLAELRGVVAREFTADGVPRLDTIYIGGGTPTLLPAGAIAWLVEGVRGILPRVADDTEITVEANPGTVAGPSLSAMRRAGVNRISIGVQSLDDRVLAGLGRTHTRADALRAMEAARAAGFENLSVDLIFGAPGQVMDSFLASLGEVTAFAPGHVSVYGLTIEPSTRFHALYGPGAARPTGLPVAPLPGEDEVCAMYERAVEALSSAGYAHYEISNFALPGCKSAHNTGCWTGRDYLGIGAGAHSYRSSPGWGRRWWNRTGAEEYMESIEMGGEARAASEELTREEALSESVMLGLRMLGRGLDAEAFMARFGEYPARALPGIGALEGEGLVEMRGNSVLLTERGVLFSNEVFARLLAVGL